ncbi:MAG: hypothetical protein IKR48_00280 [Kiritimatiellae bacterium]|nr:hypothetical protein [Kiritimatiellia bacterium]
MADVFEPKTLQTMQHYSAIVLRYVTLFIVLPVMGFASLLFFFMEMKSLTRSRKKAFALLTIAIVAVTFGIVWLWTAFFPDGVVQRYSLFQRPFVAFGEFVQGQNSPFSGWMAERGRSIPPWSLKDPVVVCILIALSALIAFVGFMRDIYGKLFYTGAFSLGAVFSVVISALAINLFTIFAKEKAHFADPIVLGDFWGNYVPMFIIACALICSLAFFIAWAGWRILGAQSMIGKVFASVWGVVSATSMLVWVTVPFLIGVFLIPLLLAVILTLVALKLGGKYTKSMFGEYARTMNAPCPTSSGPDTTTFKDEDGHKYSGSGSDPYTVTGHSDGSVYDKGADGKYHERYGNRTLEP